MTEFCKEYPIVSEKMFHPMLGPITINKVVERSGYKLAYFLDSCCNLIILKEMKNENAKDNFR